MFIAVDGDDRRRVLVLAPHVGLLGRMLDFREEGSRYGSPKAVPCRVSVGILTRKMFKTEALILKPSQLVIMCHFFDLRGLN